MIGFFEGDEGIPVAVVHLGPEVVALADRQRWQHIGGARLVKHGGRVRSAYRTGPGPDHRTGPWMPATRPPPLGTRAWQTTTFCLTRPERPPMIAPAWAVSIADRAAHLSRWAEDQCDDTTRPTGSNRGSGYAAARTGMTSRPSMWTRSRSTPIRSSRTGSSAEGAADGTTTRSRPKLTLT